MQIQLPCTWRAEGIPKRAHKPRMMEFYEVVDLKIPEIDAAFAPVCLATENTEVRYFEDAFWYPVSTEDEYIHPFHLPREHDSTHVEFLQTLKGIDTPTIADHLNNITNYAFDINRHHLGGDVKRYEPKNLIEVDPRPRTIAHGKLHEKVQGTMLIDGWLWTRSDTPVIEVLDLSGGVVASNVTPASFRNTHGVAFGCAIFDVTDDKETIEKLLRTYTDINFNGDQLEIPDCEILMPEVLKPTAAPLQFARFTTSTGIKWWEKMPRSFQRVNGHVLTQMANLKAAIDDVYESPTMETGAELERAARSVIGDQGTPAVINELLRQAVAYFEEASLSHDLQVDGIFGPGK